MCAVRLPASLQGVKDAWGTYGSSNRPLPKHLNSARALAAQSMGESITKSPAKDAVHLLKRHAVSTKADMHAPDFYEELTPMTLHACFQSIEQIGWLLEQTGAACLGAAFSF